jgi:hypothetical protein
VALRHSVARRLPGGGFGFRPPAGTSPSLRAIPVQALRHRHQQPKQWMATSYAGHEPTASTWPTAYRRRLASDWLRIGAGIGGNVKGRITSRYTDTLAIVAIPLALVILGAALPRGLSWRAHVCGTVIAVGAFIAARTRAADTDVSDASHVVTVGTCCAASVFVYAAAPERDKGFASGIRSAIKAIVRVTSGASV